MALFSQRIGKTSIKTLIQLESMDDDLKNCLWNAFKQYYYTKDEFQIRDDYLNLINGNHKRLWLSYFKYALDSVVEHNISQILQELKEYFYNCKWYEVYDFIEFVSINFETTIGSKKEFIESCNKTLQEEVSAYRFIDGEIVPITDAIELDAIDDALNSAHTSVKLHIKCAMKFLADRQNPDYRNSIKESISSVEALCKVIVKDDKATLGQALKLMGNQNNIEIHPSLKSAFEKLYGYTSDKNGIRHALSDVDNITFEEAKFMLVSCSAFVNYLTSIIDK